MDRIINKKYSGLFINKRTIFAVIFFTLIFMTGKAAFASVMVGVLPYKIISPDHQKYSYIKESIPLIIASDLSSDSIIIARNSDISSFIKKNHTNFSTKNLSKLASYFKTNYLIFGRVVKIGNTFVIQTNIFDARKNSIVYRKTVQSPGLKLIVGDVNRLSSVLRNKIDYLSAGIPAVSKENGDINAQYAHVPQTPKTKSDVFIKRFNLNGSGLVRTQSLPYVIQAITTGKLLAKGIQTIVAARHSVILYGLSVDGKLTEISRYKLAGRSNVIYLGIYRISKSNKAIVVTKSSLGSIISYLLVYKNGKFFKLTNNLNLFLRVMNIGNFKNVLVGQRPVAVAPSGRYFGAIGQNTYPIGQFGGETNIYTFNKNISSITKGRKLPFYNGITLYGTAYGNIKGDGKNYLVALSNYGHLMVINKKGNTVYTGSKTYGGSPLQVRVPSFNGVRSATYTGGLIYNIPAKLTESNNKNGKKTEIIVLKNHRQIAFLHNLNYYTESSVYSLAWNSIGFYPKWEIKPVEGYSAGFSLFRTGKKVYLADGIVADQGSILTKPKSYIIIYRIEN